MKKFLYLAVICLLANISPINAQLIIHNNGHAEIGTNPDSTNIDSVSVLKVFGDGANASAGRISIGNGQNVIVGELGTDDSDRLWLHGKQGIYITRGTAADDTIAFYNPAHSPSLTINSDVTAHGFLVQSDERYKEDIEPINQVLSALQTLEPVSYKLKSHRLAGSVLALSSKGMSANDRADMNAYYQKLEEGCERYGFLAQNVKDAFPELVHTDNDGYMSVDYIGLIPILVQSINELRAELSELKGDKQDNSLTALNAQQASQSEMEASLSAPKLYQNAPNPWSSETVIRYRLPDNVSRADIYIYDMQGAQIKSIPATGRGESQVTLTAHDLKAGMYLYALVADGALVDSKQMILTK